jgi:hypothetical protein
LNAITAPLPVNGTEPRENRVARAERGCPKQQSQRRCQRPGDPNRIRGHFQGHAGEQQARAYRHRHGDAVVPNPGE